MIQLFTSYKQPAQIQTRNATIRYHHLLACLVIWLSTSSGLSLHAQSLGTGSIGFHSSTVGADGKVCTWGANWWGQLGNGGISNAATYQDVSSSGALAGKTVLKTANGFSYSLAVAADGKVYSWGYGKDGQLGNGSYLNSVVPVAVALPVGVKITSVAAGVSHSLALADDGNVYSWGGGVYGQLGNGNNLNSNVPVVVSFTLPVGGKITSVGAGGEHSMAVATDGKVYSWGYGGSGQMGNGSYSNRTLPVAVMLPAGVKIASVADGNAHVLALTDNGKVYSWGYGGSDGRLGNGGYWNISVPSAVSLPAEVKITSVAAGNRHSLALADDGKVYSWGFGGYGELGTGVFYGSSPNGSAIPVQIMGLNLGREVAPAIATTALKQSTFCSESTVNVSFTATGTFGSGNVFAAQLSDATGSFASPTTIGTVEGTTSGTVRVTIPANTPAGAGYRIQVVSSAPEVVGTSNGTDLVVQTPPVLTMPVVTAVSNESGKCGAMIPFQATVTGSPNPRVTYLIGENPITSPHFFPVGTTVVTVKADNTCGNQEGTFIVSVNDTEAPAFTDAPLTQFSVFTDAENCTATVALTYPVATDNCGKVTVSHNLTETSGKVTLPKGQTVITWTATDAAEKTATVQQIVTVIDGEKPTISAPSTVKLDNYASNCGRDKANVALGAPITSDNCGVKSVTNDAPAIFSEGTTTVTWTVEDENGNQSTATQLVIITNAAPTLGSINGLPLDPQPLGAAIIPTVSFTDNNLAKATWTWDDGTTTEVTQISGSAITSSHVYKAAGVYTISVEVEDACGVKARTTTTQFLVMYDPTGGYINGSGWINSPAGAYRAEPLAAGRANFGFASRYQKGITVPSGKTVFHFKAGSFYFKSNVYEWLVVSGTKVQFRGSGTINGTGDYGFMLTAIDGQLNGGGGPDKLSIKIWQKLAGGGEDVVYDNQSGSVNNSDQTTVIDSGSIVIYLGGDKNARESYDNPALASPSNVKLSAYPTPFTSELTLNLRGFASGPVNIDITDQQGRLVHQQIAQTKTDNATARLQLGGLKPGMYLLQATGKNEKKWTKVIKL